jgi:hypothetical protein
MKLQATNNRIDDWTKKWRIKTNQSKSPHIAFILRNQTYRTMQRIKVGVLQKNEVKYLGMHLDRRPTWAKRIKSERKQFNQKAK